MTTVRRQLADIWAGAPTSRSTANSCGGVTNSSCTGRKEKERRFDLFNLDRLSQRLKCPGGDLVALVEFLHGFQKIGSRQIDGPRIPIAERGFETSEAAEPWVSSVSSNCLISSASAAPGPQLLEHFVAEDEPVAETDHLPEDLHCGAVGKRRQHGGGDFDVHRRRGKHQFTNLFGKRAA